MSLAAYSSETNKKHKHSISDVFTFCVKSLMFSGKGTENSAWNFFRVNFCSRDFLGFFLEVLGHFFVLILPPFNHPLT